MAGGHVAVAGVAQDCAELYHRYLRSHVFHHMFSQSAFFCACRS